MSDDLTDFTAEIADQIESFVVAVTEVARGEEPGAAVSMLLLEVSQLMLAGGRLGAIADVVPEERFEPDAGPDPDVDALRTSLSVLLEPIDVYYEVFDPYVPRPKPVAFRISDDMADVVTDLVHGLAHHRAGRTTEALWWWQFSYLANWGATASAVLRALQSVVAHTRLDAAVTEVESAVDDALGDELADELAEQLDDAVVLGGPQAPAS
ncbi:DUF5063 domain-containing protein [Yinghuangia seranimata]|uniref:DUF5063 domain-containing protein n=1 Tax=Yinghuangia seranimata TaxID=408067 RepID=UPI00248D3A8C|nr:DUF5063 domain-containing protein [Yinghuangia seranimata]MDI2127869.1 DUF5063 domain-containing protein [Yinghuangia seranimata]